MRKLQDCGYGYLHETFVKEKLTEMRQRFRPKEIGEMAQTQAKAKSPAAKEPPARKKGGLFGLFKGKPKVLTSSVTRAEVPKPAPQKQPVPLKLIRIYATARAEITLQDAQIIVMQAGLEHPILLDNTAPLVWCAAFPNEVLGQIPLTQILMHYAKQVDGDKYLNDDNQFIIAKGNYRNAESLVIAVLSK